MKTADIIPPVTGTSVMVTDRDRNKSHDRRIEQCATYRSQRNVIRY